MGLRFTFTSLAILLLAVTMTACSVGAEQIGQNVSGVQPEVLQRPAAVTDPGTTARWGNLVRWHIRNADWSLELPENGWWDFVDPFEGERSQPISATFRTETSNGERTFMFMDVIRLDTSTSSAPTCTRPTMIDADGSRLSLPLNDIEIEGVPVSVTRITPSASDGSTTGTYEFCFVTPSAMFQITTGAGPAAALPDLYDMVRSFRHES